VPTHRKVRAVIASISEDDWAPVTCPRAVRGQGELFPAWRYHAVFTDSPFETVQGEAQHRDHAIIEQVFADLNDGPLTHLPSGHFPANAAWLACAAICIT
jgi:hypothetical protein